MSAKPPCQLSVIKEHFPSSSAPTPVLHPVLPVSINSAMLYLVLGNLATSFLYHQLGVSVQDLSIMLLSHQPTGLHSDCPSPHPSLASLFFLILDWPLPLILYGQPVRLFYCANLNTSLSYIKVFDAPSLIL